MNLQSGSLSYACAHSSCVGMPDVTSALIERGIGFVSSGSCLSPRRKSKIGSVSMCAVRLGTDEAMRNDTLHFCVPAHAYASCVDDMFNL
jgi:hypothetical protein